MENEVYVLYKVSIHAPVRVRRINSSRLLNVCVFQSTHP